MKLIISTILLICNLAASGYTEADEQKLQTELANENQEAKIMSGLIKEAFDDTTIYSVVYRNGSVKPIDKPSDIAFIQEGFTSLNTAIPTLLKCQENEKRNAKTKYGEDAKYLKDEYLFFKCLCEKHTKLEKYLNFQKECVDKFASTENPIQEILITKKNKDQKLTAGILPEDVLSNPCKPYYAFDDAKNLIQKGRTTQVKEVELSKQNQEQPKISSFESSVYDPREFTKKILDKISAGKCKSIWENDFDHPNTEKKDKNTNWIERCTLWKVRTVDDLNFTEDENYFYGSGDSKVMEFKIILPKSAPKIRFIGFNFKPPRDGYISLNGANTQGFYDNLMIKSRCKNCEKKPTKAEEKARLKCFNEKQKEFVSQFESVHVSLNFRNKIRTCMLYTSHEYVDVQITSQLLLKEDGYASPKYIKIKGLDDLSFENCIDSIYENTKMFDENLFKKCPGPLFWNMKLSFKLDTKSND